MIGSPSIRFSLPTKLKGGTRRSNYVKELLGDGNIDTPSALNPFRNTAKKFGTVEPSNFKNENSVMQIMKNMEKKKPNNSKLETIGDNPVKVGKNFRKMCSDMLNVRREKSVMESLPKLNSRRGNKY